MDRPQREATQLILEEWAEAHGVPPSAIEDLKLRIGVSPLPEESDRDLKTEDGVQAAARALAATRGFPLWRNNVGGTEKGIRYGLLNDSAKINKKFKSSDLIGITPHTVTAEDIGRTVGIFTAYEVKKPGWKFREKGREAAQLAFGQLVLKYGGIFRFITDEEQI